MKKIILCLFLIVLIGGCAETAKEEATVKSAEERAIDACETECEKAVEGGIDLDNGPCLNDKVIDDWVCDVAHSPREEIDNKQENQCSAFRAGEAHHFVELDENCDLIKVY